MIFIYSKQGLSFIFSGFEETLMKNKIQSKKDKIIVCLNLEMFRK
jgi:hypothetical protein